MSRAPTTPPIVAPAADTSACGQCRSGENRKIATAEATDPDNADGNDDNGVGVGNANGESSNISHARSLGGSSFFKLSAASEPLASGLVPMHNTR